LITFVAVENAENDYALLYKIQRAKDKDIIVYNGAKKPLITSKNTESTEQQESQKFQKTQDVNSPYQASVQNVEQVLGTKVKICDISVDLHDHYVQKNHDFKVSDKEFEHFYLECKVQQKLETIVCRNGRKIMKFNIIDLEQD